MTTFTEKVEKILDDAFEMGKGLHPEDYPTLKASMLKKAEEAHQAEISRVLERVEKEVKNLPTWESTTMVEAYDVLEAINKIKGEYK